MIIVGALVALIGIIVAVVGAVVGGIFHEIKKNTHQI